MSYVYSNTVTADLGAAARSSFGELLSVSPTPIVQLDAIAGIDPQDVNTYNAGSGSASGPDANSLFYW
jgi:hypothetical protein